jgi:hypothetical protein
MRATRFVKAAVIAAAGSGMFWGSQASASLSVSLVPVPVNPGAGLSNVRTYDLKVTQTGEKFNAANLQLTVGSGPGFTGGLFDNGGAAPTGDVYQSAHSSPTDPLFYDTFLSTPQAPLGGSVAILGHADAPSNPGPGAPFASGGEYRMPAGSGSVINVAWGDTQGGQSTVGNSTNTVARISVTGNTGAFLSGYVIGTTSGFTPTTFTNLYLPILGDTDANFSVDLQDLFNVQNNFGLNANGDANGDGQTDLADLFAVQNSFGNALTPGPGATALGSVVPEPASLGFLMLASTGLLARRQRGR